MRGQLKPSQVTSLLWTLRARTPTTSSQAPNLRQEVETALGLEPGRAVTRGKKIVKTACVEAVHQLLGEVDAKQEIIADLKQAQKESVSKPVVVPPQNKIQPLTGWLRSDYEKFDSTLLLHKEMLTHSNPMVRKTLARIPIWTGILGLPSLDRPDVVKRLIKRVNNAFDTQVVETRTIDLPLLQRPTYKFGRYVVGASLAVLIVSKVSKPLAAAVGLVSSLSIFAGYLWNSWKRIPKTSINRFFLTEKCKKLADYCTEVKLFSFKNAWSYLKLPAISENTKCKENEYLVGYTTARDHVWCPRTCVHNEFVALKERQLLEPLSSPEVREDAWHHNLNAFRKYMKPYKYNYKETPEVALELFLNGYTEKRRNAIRSTLANCDGYHILNPNTKGFVKRNWELGKVPHKRHPRFVSGKHDDYLCASSPDYKLFVESMKEQYYKTTEAAIQSKFIYTSGMTADEIGLIVTHFERRGWYAYEGDFSRYDAHNEEEAIDAQFKWYEFPKELDSVLRKQLTTKGRTMSNIRFGHVGKVASGVANTSYGNTLIGFMFFAGFFEKIGDTDYVVVQLGDDNIVFTKYKFSIDEIVNYALECGHKLEICLRDDYDLLEFCSMRFWDVGVQRVLGPKPGRWLAKGLITSNPLLTEDQLPNHISGIAYSLRFYNWMPIVGAFCRGILDKHPFLGSDTYSNNFEKWIPLRIELEVDIDRVNAQFFKIYRLIQRC